MRAALALALYIAQVIAEEGIDLNAVNKNGPPEGASSPSRTGEVHASNGAEINVFDEVTVAGSAAVVHQA